MKIIKTANGKQTLKMSKTEWLSIGKKAGWKVSQPQPVQGEFDDVIELLVDGFLDGYFHDVMRGRHGQIYREDAQESIQSYMEKAIAEVRGGFVRRMLQNLDSNNYLINEGPEPDTEDITGQDEDDYQRRNNSGPYSAPDLPRPQF